MGDAMNKGICLSGAALVTATAFLPAFPVPNPIYATYRPAPVPPGRSLAAPDPQSQTAPSGQPRTETGRDVDEDSERILPDAKRLPLPVVGNAGWRLVSFNPTSLFAIALSLAALYVPAAILA